MTLPGICPWWAGERPGLCTRLGIPHLAERSVLHVPLLHGGVCVTCLLRWLSNPRFCAPTLWGSPRWVGLSSLQSSSLSAHRVLLLLWGIVCFLLPALQTHFNELFLFSCLPAIKAFPLPQSVPALGWLAWQLRLLIRIHLCQVYTSPLTLTTYRCVCSS